MSIDTERPLSNQFLYDAELILKTSAAVAAPAAEALILDLGLGRVDAEVVIDLTAVKISANDERYNVIAQFSNSATFASGIQNGPAIDFGATEVREGGAIDSVVGRYKLPVTNVINDVHYRYMRLYNYTIGTSETMTYAAWLTKK
jgi:hypothetical protein